MKIKLILALYLFPLLLSCRTSGESKRYNAIHSGVAWFDQNNNEVNAHGACIVKDGLKYYLFGEYKSDTTNAFVGFGCYSSDDLMNWQFEKLVLPVQKEGLLGPARVGERVKVMKCPSTGEYVMYMHTDDMGYKDPHVGYATCKTINGEYEFQGPLMFEGNVLRKWDLGTFQEGEKGYVLTHEGFIYELADDYKSVTRIVTSHQAPGGESPAMFKRNGTYFWLLSNKTSWERNDNYYLTSTSLEGPWTKRGLFAPEGTLTWNSQCSFVLPICNKTDTLYMYMGDRWSFPKQGSAGTQVWQPISINGDEMSLPVFYDSWHIDEEDNLQQENLDLQSIKDEIQKQGNWDTTNQTLKSNEKGASIYIPFEGEQVGIKGFTNNKSGYAKVVLKNKENKEIIRTIVDFSSKKENSSLVFFSPKLERNNYILSIEVVGEHPKWSDKKGTIFGSTDNYVTVEDVLVSRFSDTNVTFRSNTDINISIDSSEEQVVQTALDIFSKDYKAVFGGTVTKNDKGQIVIGTLGNNSSVERTIDKKYLEELRTHKEGFLIQVIKDKLYILGSDKRGTSYGILELSRLIGVSPWEWWADSHIERKNSFTLEDGFSLLEYPSVAHRGIFINDEDWGLMPWSSLTYEPSDIPGQIGPKTHARIFELLLRLRANTFWPAMHDCSVAFYFTPGNKEIADKYGIIVGTSHCEPMVRNTNAEWNTAGTGAYDYVNNRENVLKFWEERVKELAGSDNIYTLGIRGVHDSKMLGANTLQEQKGAIANILKDQREMIAKYVNPNVEEVSQVFIPYKEVLDVYNMGLEVPEDVALLWCDDNYGYLRHFPDEKERDRKGGNGIYYHISYWGRPHDYLWLSTNHPAQIYTQMKLAYNKGAKDQWIVNVGDIKPAEYLIELFMDMAWNIDGIENNIEGLDDHLYTWLSREFGEENAKELLTVMTEYYRLTYIRKPEFMGGTRTEEGDPKYKIVTDLPWSETEINQRIKEYQAIADKVVEISKKILFKQQDAWFQLIEYPVRGAAEMNKKHLYGQLARHGKVDWKISDNAFDTIVSLTRKYNSLGNSKWKKIMDYQPRRLAVFDKVPRVKAENPMVKHKEPLFLFNGNEYKNYEKATPLVHGLGYQRGAISLLNGSTVTYNFVIEDRDSIQVEIALAPNHPVEGSQLRYAISINDESSQVVNFQTVGRSEEWKENVFRNQTRRTTIHRLRKSGEQTLTIKALDEGVIVDQIKIWNY